MDSWHGFVSSVADDGRSGLDFFLYIRFDGLASITMCRFSPDIHFTECIPKIFNLSHFILRSLLETQSSRKEWIRGMNSWHGFVAWIRGLGGRWPMMAGPTLISVHSF
jgi:hypothetical protein